jgi:RNA polymerase sigma-70 factor (ECF subfamily)
VTAAQDFGAAFAAADIAALAHLLREDVALEMPPWTAWFAGRDAALEFLRVHLEPERFRLVPVMANGQPAFAAYRRVRCWMYRAHSIIVLTISGSGIARITIFRQPRLFEMFRLPEKCLPAAARAVSEFL